MKPESRRDTVNKDVLVPSFVAGSKFNKFCFSHDSRYLFCCCGSVIKVFNTTNGECLHDLQGHATVVTGVAVNPGNVLQIFSCSEDGLLISWDYLDGAKLKQHNLRMPLYGIVSIDDTTGSVMMVAQTSQCGMKNYSLLQWFRKEGNPSEFSTPKVLIPNCNRDQELISFGCMNRMAASAQCTMLTTYCMKTGVTRVMSDKTKYNKVQAITCVACHPTENSIATGLENGQILIWHNIFADKPLNSSVHWHSLAVLSIDFSPDGSILLSGGHECVFVRWQINNNYQKDFKPRMGAPLTRVKSSPDGNLFVTLHADNVVQLMDINLSILQVYRGMSRANWNLSHDKNPIPVGMTYDPRSRAIVTNGLPGHLQFFSLSQQKQLYNLDIVGQNYISPENLDQPPIVTEVRKVAISHDSKWLASFEKWDDKYFTPELRLKFWEYSTSEKAYVLNTIVESPHETEVFSMCFQPLPHKSSKVNPSPTLVTTGADQSFKLWTLVDDTDIYRANTRWGCDCVGFYKDMNTQCADFSCDGSSLAVAFEHLLTIWDPTENIVRTALSNSSQDNGIIRAVRFGTGDSRYFLMALSEKYLVSWNLLSLTVEWSVAVQSHLLLSDPMSDLMAMISSDHSLKIFQPKSCKVIYSKEKCSSVPVLEAVFVPNNRPEDMVDVGWPGSSQLYMYLADHSLITLDRSDRIQQLEKVQIHQMLPKSDLSAFMAEKIVRDKDSKEVKETQGKFHIAEDKFISVMLHSNEPVSSFCDQFLDKLLIKKKKHRLSVKKKEDDEIEELETMTAHIDEDGDEEALPFMNVDTDLLDFLKGESKASKGKNSELNRYLSESSNWVDWCASVSLK